MWLNVLTMLRRAGPAAALWLLATAAQAATLNFNGGAAGGCTLSGTTYTCATLSLGATDVVSIASNYTVVVNSALSFGYNQGLKMSGSAQLQTSGNLNIGDINPANLAVSGGTLSTAGEFKIGSQAQTIVADIKAATMTLGSGSTTRITGSVTATSKIDIASHVTINGPITAPVLTTNSDVTLNGNVSASTSFQLASGSSVTGNITSASVKLDSSGSIVKGDISTSGALDVGSQVSVTGTVNAATLVLRASGAVINGTTKITGNVSMESGTTINGDLNARDVTTASGSAVINGNIAVNSIYIDWNNSVNGVITCTGALNGTEPCSCVSKPQYYNYTPRCAAAPSNTVHHFQISHSGSGLTCQAQTVEIKACSNADCTSTVTGSSTTTLLPVNRSLTFTGSTTQPISQPTAATITLGTSGGGASAATTCPNARTGNNDCRMEFKDEGLILSAPDHLAMASGVKLNIQALKNSAGSCVPLVQGTVPVSFSCAYVNPVSNANPVPVLIGGTPVACPGPGNVSLTFDSNGLATPSLQYSEVGQTKITASYAANGLGASGAVQFTTAPASFLIEATRVSGNTPISPTAFAKASEPFNIRLTALNAENKATKNFGRETPAQSFYLDTPSLIAPATENPITMGKYKGVVDGVTVAEDGQKGYWRFDETGTIEVKVRQAHSSTYYLGNTTSGFNTNKKVALKFVPDHFDVTIADAQPMDCAKVNAISNPCPYNAGGKFLYAGQPFNVVLGAYIGAKDALGNYLPTKNYPAIAPVIDLSAIHADGTAATPGTFSWSLGQSAARFTFKNETDDKGNNTTYGRLTSGNLPAFVFPLTPTAPTTIRLRATDADQASSAGFGEALITMVSGRMEIANVSGPLSGQVPVTARAQYWNGKAYAFNSQYNSGTLQLSRTEASGAKSYFIRFDNCKNGLAGTNPAQPCAGGPVIPLASATIKFGNGSGVFQLGAPVPLPSRNGSVDVALKNGSEDLIKYLPSGKGTVIFGVYRSGPLIYTREVYN